MASGLLATFAYVVFEGSLIGGYAYFANDAMNTILGVNIPWLLFAIGAIVVIAALCHFHITLTAAILGVTLISEVLILAALAFSVIVKGGGPDGFMLDQTVLLNNAFESLPDAVRHRGGGRLDGDRSLLRVLVVGRLRDDGGLWRGVAQPEENHPARDAHRGHRARPLLHLRLGDGAGRQRRRNIGGDVDQRVTPRPLLRLGAGEPRRVLLDIYKILW